MEMNSLRPLLKVLRAQKKTLIYKISALLLISNFSELGHAKKK